MRFGHRKVLRDIRQLARRVGVRCIGKDVYHETQETLVVYMQHLLRDVIIHAEYSRRKTVTRKNVLEVLKKRGTPLYT